MINGVSEREKKILQDMMKKYFDQLPESERNWDGVEPTSYRKDKEAFSRFLRGEK